MTRQASLFGAAEVRDGRSPEGAITVSDLNAAARGTLEKRFGDLWVRGEVTNWTRSSAGHRYFSLRDQERDASVACVFFRGDAWRLPADPEDGMEVFVHGRPTLYARQGRFQLRVRAIEAAGEGLWRIAFERLRRELAAEGMLDPERKRALPAFPRRVGVVTSRKGAALHDIITVLKRRAPWVGIVVSHCRVQGEGAAGEVRAALQRLADWGAGSPDRKLDAIILSRGGGSMEDLWCFNEEMAVRAVASSPVPVICAIGHEVDVTLCELVADVRAPTPSAAAELAVPDVRSVRVSLDTAGRGLARGLRRLITRGSDRVEAVAQRLPVSAGHARDVAKLRLATMAARLPAGMERVLARSRTRLAGLAAALDALSPLETVARGYAVATDLEGRRLTRIDDFTPRQRFRLRVEGGQVAATADAVERDAVEPAAVQPDAGQPDAVERGP
ncbi:exodeoxyribonuclease VII large subunit [Candidatus Palauibacter sp.]|uniref:exodeoxyribonuclease VII large subunit n=1 Tax=Candidatus Palauibacter sp. TaxID=3101350 RepID=UPI003B010865